MIRFCRPILIAAAIFGADLVQARDSLGVYGDWGAFRDNAPRRCYAIAEPDEHSRYTARWRPFASIGDWPERGVRNQPHFRLSQAISGPVMLSIDGTKFSLIGGGADAWPPNPTADAAIIAALRSGTSMRVGSDTYTLKGAASAIDAAALGCARNNQ
ncbi:MAG: hypothetical protein KGQ42_08790 [Alphaproteobacteria bacterium]|nr:hypothetical protein [Alphaproteobacteria bacterium]MDE2042781.1 hypothetical protein [Alphaproteobacteria bacterium]MDE2339893.1 hypothetical protein [Alphaproteobacteria bacterium]